ALFPKQLFGTLCCSACPAGCVCIGRPPCRLVQDIQIEWMLSWGDPHRRRDSECVVSNVESEIAAANLTCLKESDFGMRSKRQHESAVHGKVKPNDGSIRGHTFGNSRCRHLPIDAYMRSAKFQRHIFDTKVPRRAGLIDKVPCQLGCWAFDGHVVDNL